MAVYDLVQGGDLTRRIMEKFREAGVDPKYVLNDWTLDGDGTLTATVRLRMTPAEALEIVNGRPANG